MQTFNQDIDVQRIENVDDLIKLLDDNDVEYDDWGSFKILFILNRDEFKICNINILEEALIKMRNNIIDEILT